VLRAASHPLGANLIEQGMSSKIEVGRFAAAQTVGRGTVSDGSENALLAPQVFGFGMSQLTGAATVADGLARLVQCVVVRPGLNPTVAFRETVARRAPDLGLQRGRDQQGHRREQKVKAHRTSPRWSSGRMTPSVLSQG
jgi:hypothetical protein